jgi:hypothetical protein
VISTNLTPERGKMITIQELLTKLNTWRLRQKARKKLINQYEYLIEVNKLMEEFDSERILNFDEKERRNDLLRVQQEMKGMEVMVSFLKGVNKKSRKS